MKLGTFRRFIALAAVAVGMSACGADRVTAPSTPVVPDGPSTGLLSDLLGGDLLGGLTSKKALARKTALPYDITKSAVIDEKGGTISIPEAGFTLIVPPHAVREPVTFKVTAIAGKMVAYEFDPHGTTFRVPLVARQDLSATTYSWLSLKPLHAAYFTERGQLDLQRLTALVSELIRGLTLPWTRQFLFPIEHFSGYIVAY